MAQKPMILCRTNKQVKAIEEQKYFDVSTVHQAKGLEYPNVIVIDTTIKNSEDLNIAYVAMTRAENNLLIINWQQFEQFFDLYMNK
jgi:superfamily I DNA/RNA helicase